jgi:hypothetical protein
MPLCCDIQAATLSSSTSLENPVKGSPSHPEHRKRKGGTVTPFGFRSGDKVKAQKAGQSYIGWIGGYVEKQKKVSVYDINWHRLGQFSVSKVQLVKRSTRLLCHVKIC